MDQKDDVMETDYVDEEERLIEPMEERLSLCSGRWESGVRGDQPEDLTGLFIPGDIVTQDSSFMRGHGTYVANSSLVSCMAGVVEPVNRLVSVKSPRSRYMGEIGDVVIGRILEVQVQQKKWKVQTGHKLNSTLLMSSINLPGGELRRKTEEDERMMRSYFVEGDLISAEVQSILSDGSLSLHTRNLRYGKLGQGILTIVPPALIMRRKTHFHNLPCGAQVILGNNGYVWVSRAVATGSETGGFVVDREKVSLTERQTICRLANCIQALAHHSIVLQDTSITYAFDESLEYPIDHLLHKKESLSLANRTRQRIALALK